MESHSSERRLITILAADMAGYSRLMGEDEVRTLNAMADTRKELFDPVIEARGGHVIKRMGDGWFVEFASASEAVACAIDIQNGVADHEIVRLRIGIHIGDVTFRDGDIYGDGVNVAARIEAFAEAGQIVISDTVHNSLDTVTGDLFGDGEVQAFKNIARPVRVWHWPGDVQAKASNSSGVGEGLEPPDKPSVAVLPFNNVSGDPDQEFFVDGITEDIITELSRFESLFVIARNSTFAYKGKAVDVRQVAQELGVRYLLEGSVRRSGSRIRVSAQLVHGTTGSHIWAEKFDREIEDIFELQDEITHNVVAAVSPQIEIAEIQRSRRRQSVDVTTYEGALKAKALLFDGIGLANQEMLKQAIALTEEVLERDRKNVQALWTQGFALHMLCTWDTGVNREELAERAWSAAEKLSQIDVSNPYGCMIRGVVAWDRGEHDLALDLLRRAQTLNPNFSWNLISLAWCESLAGLTAEAREHAELGLRLSPRDMDLWIGTAYLALAQASFADSDFRSAKRSGLKALELQEKAALRRSIVIASCAHLGEADEAARHLGELKSYAPSFLSSVLDGSYSLYVTAEHQALLIEGFKKAETPT
jgi:adenylate cyclase